MCGLIRENVLRHKAVPHSANQGQSRCASHAQQLSHKLACFGTQLCMPPHVNSHNALHGLNARLTFEGRLTTKHLEEQHTCGPDVDGVVVRSVLYHLRGEVVHRSDDCLARGFHLRNGRTATEVRKLCHILSARDNLYEHVLRLHVAVHDALCMHVHQALRHIRKCSGCLSILKAAECLQKLEESAARYKFQHNVHECSTFKVAKQFHHVGMVKLALRQELPAVALLDVCTARTSSLHRLQRIQFSAASVQDLPNFCNGALAKQLQHHEVVEVQEREERPSIGHIQVNRCCGPRLRRVLRPGRMVKHLGSVAVI
mmetsp:Transcript_64480/g.170742  ORF Transcript_64480/g.170742 Transcript_64480/m.170742 type:complete len:314 (+) Transcript_64480:555-1496(+)